MARQQIVQHADVEPKPSLGALHVTYRERHALSTRDVMAFIGAPTMTAARCWLHRKGIVRDGYGRVDQWDVQRALKQRSRRGRHINSLANLGKVR